MTERARHCPALLLFGVLQEKAYICTIRMRLSEGFIEQMQSLGEEMTAVVQALEAGVSVSPAIRINQSKRGVAPCGAEQPLRYLDACAAPGGKTLAAVDTLPDDAFVRQNAHSYVSFIIY